MNDLRIEAFLTAVRGDLRDLFPSRAAEERLLEMRSHLAEAVSEAQAAGDPDPVATALAEFGKVDGYRLAASTEGPLRRSAERTALKWAASILLLPMAADLAMDASSWLTGSDSKLSLLIGPMLVVSFLGFALASMRVRRFLAAPLLGWIFGSFLLYAALGGLTRASSLDWGGTQSRGTAFQRRRGIVEETLPRSREVADQIDRGTAAFEGATVRVGVGEFRTAEGYLAPYLSSERIFGPGDDRYKIEALRYDAWSDYARARSHWQKLGPTLSRYARLNVQGYEAEVRELDEVVGCPWGRSVKAGADGKVAMGLAAAGLIFTAHGVGILLGAAGRFRRRRRFA